MKSETLDTRPPKTRSSPLQRRLPPTHHPLGGHRLEGRS